VQRGRVRIALEQRRRDLVDALVGALRREDRRDEQFVGVAEVQLGIGAGMLALQLPQNRPGLVGRLRRLGNPRLGHLAIIPDP
jgi:hypothetical protein